MVLPDSESSGKGHAMKRYAWFFLLALPLVAADPSLNGIWQLSLNVNGNTYAMQCTFQQDGEKLAGTCKSEEGENPLSGQIQGQKITWQHQTPYNGETLTLTYSGTVSSPTEIKGTLDVQPYAVTGDFTGQKEPPAEGK
jgi:hypothetical protein